MRTPGFFFTLLVQACGAALLLMIPYARADQFDRARAQIQYVMSFHHIPSVTVAVAHKGKVVWEESFGWADVARRIPATPHTSYSIASISKPVTATALMILVERGVIDLDKPIDDYLGKQKLTARVGRASDATVRRVAGHIAGLPLHAQYFYEDESASPPPRDETIRRYGALVTPAGEAFVYSNLGYGLIEYAIERASGKSYAQFLRDEVFAPLSLSSGAVNPRPDADSHVASRYWLNDILVPLYDFDQQGGGAVFMSAHDLVRFGMFHLHGRIDGRQKAVLPLATLESMREPSALNDGSPAGYGIGWFIDEQHGLKRFFHNGGMAGVATVLSIYPEAEAVIVVLANGVSIVGAVHGLERDIVHAVLPETIRHDHGFKPQPELTGAWEGQIHTYSGEMPVALDFRENGSVFARLGESAWQEVVNVKLEANTSGLLLDDVIGTIPTTDTARHPGKLQFSLKLRAPDTLNGAISSNSLERLPDRMGNALSYWVELRRQQDTHARSRTVGGR
jgi:CubicO group peptidase (beta-lactamase class C family)